MWYAKTLLLELDEFLECGPQRIQNFNKMAKTVLDLESEVLIRIDIALQTLVPKF